MPDKFIKFICKACGQKIKIAETAAGKHGRCPKCDALIIVPAITESMLQPACLHTATEEPSPGLTLESTNEAEEPPQRKLPWSIDIFLYPASLNGMIYIGIFLVLSFLVGLAGRFLVIAGEYGLIFSLLFRLLLAGYIFYYISYCIFDSSKGNIRAPAIAMQHAPDIKELFFQILLILGSVAICFSPAAIYYGLTEQTGLIFWIVAACGGFFFPMALLAAVLFDEIGALNPIFVIGSILRTFLPYCGLVLLVFVFTSLVIVTSVALKSLPLLRLLSGPANIYFALIGAHLLGRFHFKYKQRLDWGI
ncbi:MAG: hypothetical protein PVG93_00390 [Phycisphaerales bacterium]|jgi:hypothetical protein